MWSGDDFQCHILCDEMLDITLIAYEYFTPKEILVWTEFEVLFNILEIQVNY